MKINGKEYLSPQEQLYENTKDIEKLKLKIKEAYKCVGELNTASISVTKSLTNAGEDVKEGWLLDTVGNLFSITGGDEYSLLLDFYCSIRGPQGETGESGAALEIDDTGTSATKVWSSNKVNTEVEKAKDKGIYFTKTQPTYDSGTGYYILDEGHFTNLVSNIPIKTFDLVLYIDSNNKVKDMYYAISKTGSNWTLNKEAEFSQGKQLYMHNIKITGSAMSQDIFISLQILDEKNLPYVKAANYISGTNQNLHQFFIDRGLTCTTALKTYPCALAYWGSRIYFGVGADSTYILTYDKSGATYQAIGGTTVQDDIEPA